MKPILALVLLCGSALAQGVRVPAEQRAPHSTRLPHAAAAGTLPAISTTSPLTPGTVGSAYSFQFTATGTTPITWAATGVPAGLTLGSAGQLSGTPTASGTFTLNVTATNAQGTQSGAPTAFTLVIASDPSTAPTISTSSPLTAGVVGTAYSLQFAATGTTPITWTATGIPSGLSLSSSGLLSGTPSSTGTSTIQVTATNVAGTQSGAPSAFTLVINSAPPMAPSITTTSPLTSGTAGSPYSRQFAATGTTPITWTATGVPAGLTLTSAGLLSGTPSTAGTYTLAVTATNAAGTQSGAPTAFTLVVAGIPPVISTASPLTPGTVSSAYSLQFAATGTTPITWTATGVPAGLTLSSSGLLSGTPTTPGTYTLHVTASNVAGTQSGAPTAFTLVIAGIRPTITTSTTLPAGTVGIAYSLQFTATGTMPITWTATGLPTGFTVSSSGLLSGMTTTPGTATLQVTATNVAGTQSGAPSAFTLVMAGIRPVINTNMPLPSGTVGTAYSGQLNASGTAPITWTATGQPGWMTISSAGAITGTPDAAAVSTIAVTAANAWGSNGPVNFSITITASGGGGTDWSNPPTQLAQTNIVGQCDYGSGTACTVPIAATTAGQLEVAQFQLVGGTVTSAYVGSTAMTCPAGAALTSGSMTIATCYILCGSSPAGATSLTATTGTSGAFRNAFFYEESVNRGGCALDTDGATAQSSASPIPGQGLTLSGSDDFVVQGIYVGSPGSALAISGSYVFQAGAMLPSRASAYLQDATAGTAPSWTVDTASAAVVNGIAFVGTGGSAGTLPTITTVSPLSNATQGSAYTSRVTASGSAPITWTATGVPAGLTLSSSGALAGTPTGTGTFTLQITATNAYGTQSGAPSAFSLTVTAPAAAIYLGPGKTTYNCIDWDGDGYGVGDCPNGPDADDNDATVNTLASVLAKYGTVAAFLTHFGYTPPGSVGVSPTGDDATCVRQMTADAAVAAPCHTTDHAVLLLHAGDALIWNAGTYATFATGNETVPVVGGTSAHPTLYLARPGDSVILDFTSSPLANGFSANDQSYWTLGSPGVGGGLIVRNLAGGYGVDEQGYSNPTNITIQGTEFDTWGDDLFIQGGSTNLTVNKVYLHDANFQHNIYFGANPNISPGLAITNSILARAVGGHNIHLNGRFTGCHIAGNIMYAPEAQNMGLQEGVNNCVIENNLTFTSFSGPFFLYDYGDQSDGNNVAFAQNHNTFRNNTFYYDGGDYLAATNNCGLELQRWADLSGSTCVKNGGTCTGTPNDCTANGNTCTAGVCSGSHYGGGGSCTNSAMTCTGGTGGSCNYSNTSNVANDNGSNTLDNNLFITQCPVGFNANAQIELDTDINGNGGLSWLRTDTFRNNIFWNAGPSTNFLTVNNFNGASTANTNGEAIYTFAQFEAQLAAGLGTNLQVNPLITAANPLWYNAPGNFDFHLQPGSPAANAGLASDCPTTDITGKARTGGCDIGAYQH